MHPGQKQDLGSKSEPAVSDLRQSRRLVGGGAAQSRMALRAVIARLACLRPRPSQCQAVRGSTAPEGNQPLALVPSPARCSHGSCYVSIPHNYPEIFPDLSNSGSLPGRAGGSPVHLEFSCGKARFYRWLGKWPGAQPWGVLPPEVHYLTGRTGDCSTS
jgi:hypothetical protein